MVYVDLNPIWAGLAETPEGSDFISIQERIRVWQRQTMATGSAPEEAAPQVLQPTSVGGDISLPDIAAGIPDPVPESLAPTTDSLGIGGVELAAPWLWPISSDSKRRRILQMTAEEYFDLVDRSRPLMRSDKRGAMDAGLAPILLRIGANPAAWSETISCFGSRFRLAAGLLSNLRNLADQLGKRWFTGVAAARAAFASSAPQSA
jgi:hypothetical protein